MIALFAPKSTTEALIAASVLVAFIGLVANLIVKAALRRRRQLRQTSQQGRSDGGPWLLAEYRWEPGVFYPCKVRGVENAQLGTYTIMFHWGCLQPSTHHDQIKWDEEVEVVLSETTEEVTTSKSNGDDNDDDKDDDDDDDNNIWVAARKGDVETVRRLAKTMEDINALEPVSTMDGRSALYWACLTGRIEVVELLLALGARDTDGSAFQAATCSDPVRARTDERDLLFDPDENLFTDNVVRAAIARTDGSDDASRKIRALLTAARTTGLRCPPPAVVFDRPSTQCCVCFESFSAKPPAVCSPCGHSASCAPCLKKIRSSTGCPVCRSRIREIIPLVDLPNTNM